MRNKEIIQSLVGTKKIVVKGISLDVQTNAIVVRHVSYKAGTMSLRAVP